MTAQDAQYQELMDALRPFRDDFLFFAPRCLNILDKAGVVKPLTLNQAQLWVHHRVETQRRELGRVKALVLKGRQQGMSTYFEGRYYWLTSMNPGRRALVLTHLGDSTDALFDMTKRYHDLCPPEIRPSTTGNNAKELVFGALDSGYVVGTAGSRKGLGRGRTFQLFHGSEFAFWENAKAHFAGLGQTVPERDDQGNVIPVEMVFESTANGVGNPFHTMWQNATRGADEEGNPYDYEPIFVPWFWQREYARPADDKLFERLSPDDIEYMQRYRLGIEQMAWRANKIGSDFHGDIDLFNQEYPASPLLAFTKVSGDTLIQAKHVERAMDPALPVLLGNLPPVGPVIGGLDPAEYGSDASALVVRHGRRVVHIKRWWKRGPMELVGLVAAELKNLSEKKGINLDAINVDIGGLGSGVCDRLTELGYPTNRVGFGEKATQEDIYLIRRDEMWGEMRSWIEDPHTILPKDDTLAADMCGPTYTYDSSRRMKLEPKETMRKRGINSPDSADALALTFAVPFAIETTGPQGGADEWRRLRDRRDRRR